MSTKDILLSKIEQAPEYLLIEILDFVQFSQKRFARKFRNQY